MLGYITIVGSVHIELINLDGTPCYVGLRNESMCESYEAAPNYNQLVKAVTTHERKEQTFRDWHRPEDIVIIVSV